MKNKFFTRFICIMLATLCLPALNAFAAIGVEKGETASTITEIIDTLQISIEVPAGGRVPSFEATALPSSMLEYKIANYNYEYDSEYYHNFYKRGIQWYDLDNDRALKEGEAFVTGTRYRVDIGIQINYGTDIWGIPYYAFDENVTGYVNGERCTVSSFRGNNKDKFRELSYTFPPCEDAPADIGGVNLWISEPLENATADFTFTTNDVGYEPGEGGQFAVNGVTWYDADTSVDMDITDTFKAGRRYTVAIELKAVSPYMFATNSNGTSRVYATVNGYKAEVYCNAQTVSDMDKEIWVRYTFEACKSEINTVEVMDFSLPQEGKKGDITMSSPDDSIYTVEGITWQDSISTIATWNKKTGYTSQNGVFESGVTYTVTVTLAAKSGYKFATDNNGKPAVTASAGGFEMQVTEHYAYASDSYIMVTGRFICKQSLVSFVKIINLEEPLAGKRPDYFVNSLGVGYRIDNTSASDTVLRNGQYVERYYKFAGVSWFDINEGRYIYEDEVFVQGHVYTAYIDIVANSDRGYEFKYNEESESVVEATVNGNQALADPLGDNGALNHYVEYIVSCHYVFEGNDGPELGDVNGDGYVDNLDAAMILKYDAGLTYLMDEQLIIADVNGDGCADNLDAAKILKFDAGIIDSL